MKMRSFIGAAVAAMSGLALHTSSAMAGLQWKIDEVYTNTSGGSAIQFVEFGLPDSPHAGNNLLKGEHYVSATQGNRHFDFDHDLPSEPQAGSHFLIGTPAYAALPGVPAPDYVFDGPLFSFAVDTLIGFTDVSTDTFSWDIAHQVPTDGVNSFNRAIGSSDITIGLNSPTNFAGQTGFVPEPSSFAVLGLGGLGLLARRRRG